MPETVPEVDTEHTTVVTMRTAAEPPDKAGDPVAPVESPAMWTLAASARREFEQTVKTPAVNPLAGRITHGLVTDTSGQDTQPIAPQPTDTWPPASFTGQPSAVSRAFSAVFGVVAAVGKVLHVDVTIPVARLLSSPRPPRLTTLGLNVQRTEFEGVPVWSIESSDPVGKYVVGLHGGAQVLQPLVLNWLDYAAIARNTGATVIVPIYRLSLYGGTAGKVVPAVADLITAQVIAHGADNVSVYGDSAAAASHYPRCRNW